MIFRLRPVLWSAIALVFCGTAQADTIPCSSVSTLADLVSGNDCIQQDKLFSDWNYSVAGDAGNVGTLFNLLTAPVQDIHGLTFERSGGWTFAFTISYRITVISGPFVMTMVDTQWNWPFQTSGNAMGITRYTDSVPGPTVLTATPALSDPARKALTNPVLVTEVIHEYIPGTMSNILKSIETSVVQDLAIPEPGTYVLMGSALLAFGAWVRRRG